MQTITSVARSFARPVIAFLLLSLVTFTVLNPIWECTDHLDNLRHLGPHGVLVLLLAVALAGVSLLRTVRSLLVGFLALFAVYLEPSAILSPSAAVVFCSLAPESGPPLRI